MPFVESVNLGRPEQNAWKKHKSTGISKHAVDGPVQVRDPGPKTVGLGSGLVGDFIGDGKHHGGDAQAVYAFQREDLDVWEARLARLLPNGSFGENLTTMGLDVNEARIGERWRVGSEVELQVTSPRIPCATFRGKMGEKGWAKMFTATGRSGAYLSVVTPGTIRGGDPVEVSFRPDHDVTVSMVFLAITIDRDLMPRLLAAQEYLDPETVALVRRRELILLD
jgi:MOSC domain-containing protein YiiM